jgi:hypothetical protein
VEIKEPEATASGPRQKRHVRSAVRGEPAARRAWGRTKRDNRSAHCLAGIVLGVAKRKKPAGAVHLRGRAGRRNVSFLVVLPRYSPLSRRIDRGCDEPGRDRREMAADLISSARIFMSHSRSAPHLSPGRRRDARSEKTPCQPPCQQGVWLHECPRPAWTGSLGGAGTIYSCEAFSL